MAKKITIKRSAVKGHWHVYRDGEISDLMLYKRMSWAPKAREYRHQGPYVLSFKNWMSVKIEREFATLREVREWLAS